MENKNTQDFETALAAFIANSQEKVNVDFKTNYPRLAVPTLIVMPGVKNVRIVRNEEVSRSVCDGIGEPQPRFRAHAASPGFDHHQGSGRVQQLSNRLPAE